jgi:hypothetical protein
VCVTVHRCRDDRVSLKSKDVHLLDKIGASCVCVCICVCVCSHAFQGASTRRKVEFVEYTRSSISKLPHPEPPNTPLVATAHTHTNTHAAVASRFTSLDQTNQCPHFPRPRLRPLVSVLVEKGWPVRLIACQTVSIVRSVVGLRAIFHRPRGWVRHSHHWMALLCPGHGFGSCFVALVLGSAR